MYHKYCHHCRKDGHTDAECWSTRVVPSHQPSTHQVPWPFGKTPPPMTETEIRRIVREELARARADGGEGA